MLTQIILPIIIFFVMFGMGLSLKASDFSPFIKTPQPIIAGIIGQIFFLPLVAYFVVTQLDLSPTFAIGLMLIGACPGATTSNVFSQLSRANLALSISLTATSALICIISSPFIVAISLKVFGAEQVDFSVVKTSLGVFFISLLPVLIGMFIHHKKPAFAMKSEPFFRKISAIAVLVFVISLFIRDWSIISQYFAELALATFLLNSLTILVGITLALIFKLSMINRLTLGIEVGVQNSALAILIATNFIGDVQYSYPALIYTLTMYIGVMTFITIHKHFFPDNRLKPSLITK